MSSRDRKDDPRPIVALAAAILGLAAWHLVSHAHLHRHGVPVHPGSLVPYALGALAIATAAATHRVWATRRTLASRRAVAVVPADGFEPRPETVAAFAAALAAGSRRIGGWSDRRASTVRVRLTNDARGRLVYLVSLPARDLSRLRAALGPYRGVELRDPADVLAVEDGPARAAERPRAVRAELVLARPSSEPLARPPLDPDPLAPFAAALAGVSWGRGETVEVCVDLLPAVGMRATRLRRRMRRQARRRGRRGGPAVGEVLGGVRGGGLTDPIDLYDRRALAKGIEAKLREGATLFEAQVLVRVVAPEKARAKAVLAGVLDAFSTTGDRNHLQVRGRRAVAGGCA